MIHTDPDQAGLREPFACEVQPGLWVIAKWLLIPKLQWDGWWIPHYWAGPGSRTWIGRDDNRVPVGAARFPNLAVAGEALATETATPKDRL